MAILTDILRPSVVTKIVSRIRTPGNVFSRWLGIQDGGAAVRKETLPVAQTTYDIFDNTRDVAQFRARGVEAGTISPNPVGNNTVSFIRSAEKMPMDYNKIAAIRTIGENAGNIDIAGKRYIEKQAYYAKKRQSNARELIAGSLANGGKIYMFQSGDSLIPSYTSTNALFAIDFKLDANHVSIGSSFGAAPGITMNFGAGNLIPNAWSNNATDICLQLMGISAAFQAEVGEPLTDIWISYNVWNNVIQNTLVRQFAGTANEPVFEWDMQEETNAGEDLMEGEKPKRVGIQIARIKNLPWVRWHIYDGVINVYDGTSSFPATSVIPQNYALFTIDPDFGANGWLEGIEGTEFVKENDLAAAKPVTGSFSWIMEKADPGRFDLHTLQNFTMGLYIPKAISLARVQ